jgi:hypothetical protein
VTYRGLAFSYEFLATQATGKQMNPILGTVHARASRDRTTTLGTRARSSSTCSRRRWRCHFETGEVVKLAKGDSLYFDSRVGHAYISTSRQLARTLGLAPARAI